MENIQEQTEEQAEPTTLQFGQGQEEGTLSNEEGQVEEVSGWESDKRFSSHWNESPDKMYETLKYNEKRHGEYDKQVKELNANLESYKQKASDFDTLNTFLEQNGEVQNTILNALEQSKNGTARQQQVGQNQLPNEYAFSAAEFCAFFNATSDACDLKKCNQCSTGTLFLSMASIKLLLSYWMLNFPAKSSIV